MLSIPKSSWIVVVSGLAILLLLVFQINWMNESRKLVQEQFDQQATMALASAVEELSRSHPNHIHLSLSCEQDGACADPRQLISNVDVDQLAVVLEAAMRRYAIDLDFSFDIIPVAESVPTQRRNTYCSAMHPLRCPDQKLWVQFSGQDQYFMDRMGFMAGASLLIVLLVAALFAATLFRLVQLRRLHALSVDFFNNMAHEFRTPLTNIGLALRMWQKKNPAQAEHRYVTIIESESQRLLHQVARILQVAQLEKGDFALEKEPVDLRTLLDEVSEEMRLQIEAKGGTLTIDSGKNVPTVLSGDRLHLSNVLRNLIENALKYNERVPRLHLRVMHHEHSVRLRLQDNGSGIPEKVQTRIFNSFQRGMVGDVHNQKGFGLGLAYAKQIALRHGGDLRLLHSSEQGSCFELLLPIQPIGYAVS